MKKILALVGDFYHPADYLTEGLNNNLNQLYSLEIKESYQNILWDELDKYDLLILAAAAQLNPEENDQIWMTEHHQDIIDRFVSNGGGLLVLHSGLAGYPTDGIYRKIVKGHFIEHPPEHPEIKIYPINTENELTQGIEVFNIVDEQYFVDVDEEDTKLFLEANSKEFGCSIAGWAHSYKEGKVSCLTPGHTLEVLENDMMRKLINNSVEWCLSDI